MPLLSHQTPATPPTPTSPHVQRDCNNMDQACAETPSSKSKTFKSTFGKLWAGFKRPKSVLAKHLNVNKRLRRWMAPRTKKPGMAPEEPQSAQDATNTAGPTSEPNPSLPIIQETAVGILNPPEPPIAVSTATESSLSLSPQPGAPANVSRSTVTHQPQSIIDVVEGQFGTNAHHGASFSDASTLQNSDVVNDSSSHRRSAVQSFARTDSTRGSINDTSNVSAPPFSSQELRPSTPCLRINTEHLNVPASDDEDGQSTVRGRSSSAASDIDFSGMGVHLEESISRSRALNDEISLQS